MGPRRHGNAGSFWASGFHLVCSYWNVFNAAGSTKPHVAALCPWTCAFCGAADDVLAFGIFIRRAQFLCDPLALSNRTSIRDYAAGVGRQPYYECAGAAPSIVVMRAFQRWGNGADRSANSHHYYAVGNLAASKRLRA